jgi:hypothetical protein
MAQVEGAGPGIINLGGRRDDRAVQVEGGCVVSDPAGELVQRHVGFLAVLPDDMDRRRGVALRVDLSNHEVPFGGVAFVIREGSRIHGNDLRVGSLGGVLRRSAATRRTCGTEKHEGETDQGKHSSEE